MVWPLTQKAWKRSETTKEVPRGKKRGLNVVSGGSRCRLVWLHSIPVIGPFYFNYDFCKTNAFFYEQNIDQFDQVFLNITHVMSSHAASSIGPCPVCARGALIEVKYTPKVVCKQWARHGYFLQRQMNLDILTALTGKQKHSEIPPPAHCHGVELERKSLLFKNKCFLNTLTALMPNLQLTYYILNK